MTDAVVLLDLPCGHCGRAAQGQRTGRFHLHCVGCCARLVRSCRPWRAAQEGMFAIIARQPGRPVKADVVAQIKALDAQGVMC